MKKVSIAELCAVVPVIRGLDFSTCPRTEAQLSRSLGADTHLAVRRILKRMKSKRAPHGYEAIKVVIVVPIS